jgi:hypothetical protein
VPALPALVFRFFWCTPDHKIRTIVLQVSNPWGRSVSRLLNPSLAYGLGGACSASSSAVPGLSATLCIALLTTLTIKRERRPLILICSYVGTTPKRRVRPSS